MPEPIAPYAPPPRATASAPAPAPAGGSAAGFGGALADALSQDLTGTAPRGSVTEGAQDAAPALRSTSDDAHPAIGAPEPAEGTPALAEARHAAGPVADGMASQGTGPVRAIPDDADAAEASGEADELSDEGEGREAGDLDQPTAVAGIPAPGDAAPAATLLPVVAAAAVPGNVAGGAGAVPGAGSASAGSGGVVTASASTSPPLAAPMRADVPVVPQAGTLSPSQAKGTAASQDEGASKAGKPIVAASVRGGTLHPGDEARSAQGAAAGDQESMDERPTTLAEPADALPANAVNHAQEAATATGSDTLAKVEATVAQQAGTPDALNPGPLTPDPVAAAPAFITPAALPPAMTATILAPLRAAPPPPVTQVSDLAVSLSFGAAANEGVEVVLEPAELGHVRISVARDGKQAVLQVAAERPETLALLQRDSGELNRALQGAGVVPEGGLSMEFSLSGGNTGSGAGNNPGDTPRGTSGPKRGGYGGNPAQVIATTDRPARVGRALLDIAI